MEGLSQDEKIIWNCWEQKTPREIVREAAAKGTHIYLAIKFLMNKNGWNKTTAQEWFNDEVTAWTVQLLMRKQIFKVLHVLGKVKFNVEEHLMTVAQTSDQIDYRDFVVEQLEKLQKDMKQENIENWEDFRRHWNLLRVLEKSFEVDGTFKQNKVFGTGKERIVVTESEIIALTIEKIMKYPVDWKKKVATSLFFRTFEFSLLDFSTPEEMWIYLLDNNKAMILVRWINIQMSEVVRDMNARYNFFNNERFSKKILNTDAQGYPDHILDSLDEIFRKWQITKEMISSVAQYNCFTYTKMCIYDTLCSYGVVNDDDRKNLYQIVRRLARTQNLNLIDDIFSESCATMTIQQFYVELAKYCVKHKLYKMLTICVECTILDTDLSEVEKDAKEVIELWLLFKSIEQTSDRQSHVVPVYNTCEQIAKDNIGDYISANPQLVLGMILLEDNAKLFDIFSKEDYLQFSDFRLPNEGYKEKLPHLYNIYQKFNETKKMYEHKDVNVYQLLSGYKGLDISKIFEFQLLNHNNSANLYGEKPDRRSLGSLLSSEMDVNHAGIKALLQKTVDMPDFANEKLMKRYGYVAKLNHMYYLKQYRPCNASQAFVAQQYQNYNRLQDKNIKSACCEAHALALQNWNDPAMVACAISFVAMIGCNPSRCRVHMSSINMIKNYLMYDKQYSEEKINKIIQDYSIKLIQSNENVAKEILQSLEEITIFKLKDKEQQNGKVDMATVLYESQTMVKFAVLHQLPLPEMQLREFVKSNSWFNFLLFGDVFRYPLVQMLRLSQEFENKSYAEHLKHIMLHRSSDDGSEKSSSSSGQRRVSRMNSIEVSPSHSGVFEFPAVTHAGGELWEVAAACHGPEDPPAALLRAANEYKEPILVLVASCYEPNAIDILWPQWILASLGPTISSFETHQLDGLKADEQFQKVAELCLSEGYVSTLHESMLIFMPESPLTLLTSFLYRSLRQLIFDEETNKLLVNFLSHCQRRYSVDTAGQPWQLSKEALQKVAVALVKISLSQGFDSAFHQRGFLKCIAFAQFNKGFSVPTPNFMALYDILEISMETSLVISISRLLQDDAEEYLVECVETFITHKNFDVALKIAKLAGFSVNNILIAEWTQKHDNLLMNEESAEDDKSLVFFMAQCSEAFRKAAVTFKEATDFLSRFTGDISTPLQKFYSFRIILSWFEEHLEYGKTREEVEHVMWEAYFQAELSQKHIFLNSCQNTLCYVLSEQKDLSLAEKVVEKPFSSLLSEIEIESDVGSIEKVVVLEEPEAVDAWRKVMNRLLELRLLVDAFRLSVLFSTVPEYRFRYSVCPVNVVRTCLKLAEGVASPYDMPQELRLVIASPLVQSKLSMSEISDASFEELVEIQDKSAEILENVPITHLAAREDADRLSALDAMALRTALPLVKQIASYFRIAIQIGWQYTAVLKYEGHPVNFINLVSGRARMTLANLVFKTFNVPSKQVADYLSHEMVSAVISPHLLKMSTFRQKEHFQYTLWGYALNSDIEMFLNMRPDACRHIGRQVLDYLMAFQKIYKVTSPSTAPKNVFDDSNLDVDTLVDEEYQNIDNDEALSIFTEGTLMSAETESTCSMSTVFTVNNKLTRETRRNLFDIIASSNVQIRYEIKTNIRKITKGAKLSSKQVNIICIELLVIAHACFRWGCDVEGVAVCVRSAQALAARLLAARSYRLMVRLLTNTKLYTEGAYILHALRDNHQFEFLLGQFDYMLGQQPESIAEFKQGLLDFLRNHCPGDIDTYIMVALHFNMYDEAAHMKRKQATDLINDLEKMAIDSSKGSSKKPAQWPLIHDNVPTRTRLETALNHCTDAAELYLQGGCTGFAGEMATLAQQIALQISLLNASPTRLILNRTTEQMYKLVSEYLSFMEGVVLVCGRWWSVWRELAYRRVLTNDQIYLRDMAQCRPDVAQHCLNRYKTEKNKTPASQAAMTELRNLCR